MEKRTEFGPLVMEEIGKTWTQVGVSKNDTFRNYRLLRLLARVLQ